MVQLRTDEHRTKKGALVFVTWAPDRLSARLYVEDRRRGRLRNLDIIFRGRRHGHEGWFSFRHPTDMYRSAELVIAAVMKAHDETPIPIEAARQEPLIT